MFTGTVTTYFNFLVKPSCSIKNDIAVALHNPGLDGSSRDDCLADRKLHG